MRSQQNDVFALVQDLELDPHAFEWRLVESKQTSNLMVSQLGYVDHDFFFTFDLRKRQHFAEFSPGAQTLVQHEFPGSWDGQVQCVARWLGNLSREMKQADLWDGIAQVRLLGVEQAPLENHPFSYREVQRIEAAIREVTEKISQIADMTPDRLRVVEERLAYLTEAAQRQGRRDWVHTAIGVFVSLAAQVALSNENVQMIWSVLKSYLGSPPQILG